MKNCKTINKYTKGDIFKIEQIKYSIQGKILYITSSENNNMFIITDCNYFYVIDKGIEKFTKRYKISSFIKKYRKFQTQNNQTHIWCDKLGNHVIIKYYNNLYYYNPHIPKEKIQELNLYYNNCYLQPYAIAFNNDFYDTKDTGDILFSDFNSDIYQLRIQINEKNKIRPFFFRIFTFNEQPFEFINKEDIDDDEDEEDDFSDLVMFKMEKNEVILDLKIFFSFNSKDIYDKNLDNKGKNILILANTRNKIFQFYGKDSYEKVFQNYSLDDNAILKAYKLFHNKKNFNLNSSRIQIFNQHIPFYNFESFKKPHLLFSCIFQSGYCIGVFNDSLNPTPTKEFVIYNYPKTKNNNSLPIAVSQSIINIFYLYDDCLIIKNKLTNRVSDTIYLKEKMNDIYYNIIMNEIIFYSEDNIYKISLDLESKYLWEYYVEIGNYKYALQTLTKEDKYMKPILHKLYANLLFSQKKYLEAAEHYAFSDEKFENICLKFLCLNNLDSLLRYLSLIFHFKVSQNNQNRKSKKITKKNNYVEKYLLNTWIFELLIIKKEEYKKDEIIPFIRGYTRNSVHGKEFIDKNILYFVFNCYGKYDELIDYAIINQDYELVIFTLINIGKPKEALDYIRILFSFGIDNINNIMKKMFYKYGYVFMKKNPKETIDLLDNNFNITENTNEIIRIILSFNFRKKISSDETLKTIINYIKNLLIKKININKVETNKLITKNLYHLLFLFLSLITDKENIPELFTYLECLNNKHKNVFDMNFAKIIFKNNPKFLFLINYLLSDYNQLVTKFLDNNLNKDLRVLVENIHNNDIKNEIIHFIVEYKKKKKLLGVIEIHDKNNNKIIIIDDFVLQITDNLKIKIFNDDISFKSIIDSLLK